VITPIACLRENGEDDNALGEGNDSDDCYHDGTEDEKGGEGGRNGEDKKGGGKEAYKKQERDEEGQPGLGEQDKRRKGNAKKERGSS
jgi:hypothetical protein